MQFFEERTLIYDTLIKTDGNSVIAQAKTKIAHRLSTHVRQMHNYYSTSEMLTIWTIHYSMTLITNSFGRHGKTISKFNYFEWLSCRLSNKYRSIWSFRESLIVLRDKSESRHDPSKSIYLQKVQKNLNVMITSWDYEDYLINTQEIRILRTISWGGQIFRIHWKLRLYPYPRMALNIS